MPPTDPRATARPAPPTVAVVGAGMAGTACAVALHRAGRAVVLFDKSRGVGGRMATRRTAIRVAPDVGVGVGVGADADVEFDHGAPHFDARDPRFRALVHMAVDAGVLQPWRLRTPEPRADAGDAEVFVPRPGMPALCRHLLAGAGADTPVRAPIDLRVEHAVARLERDAAGWRFATVGGAVSPPFGQVVLALPPAQAAALLADAHGAWAAALARVTMEPCWTLMAVSDEVDWPWDEALPGQGPLARVLRNDRKPGRTAAPGRACWVAHATAAWTQQHLEATDPQALAGVLQRALQSVVSPARPLGWHFAAAHRWRYAVPAGTAPGAPGTPAPWWDPGRGLGVCGDFLGAGGVEAAWLAGDGLAAAMLGDAAPDALG